MGEEVRGVSEAAPLSAEAAEAEHSIGRYLAGQRRLRGVSLDDLAELTKIPRRSLVRLEDGAFENVTVLSDRDVLSGRLGRLTGQGLRLELTLQQAEVWRHTERGLRRGMEYIQLNHQ